MIKVVEVTFKKNVARPVAHYYNHISRAIVVAGYNMRRNHGIEILDYKIKNDAFYVKIDIPEALCNPFNPGKRLRGISNFLLNNYPVIFEPLRDGHQLFSYLEVE